MLRLGHQKNIDFFIISWPHLNNLSTIWRWTISVFLFFPNSSLIFSLIKLRNCCEHWVSMTLSKLLFVDVFTSSRGKKKLSLFLYTDKTQNRIIRWINKLGIELHFRLWSYRYIYTTIIILSCSYKCKWVLIGTNLSDIIIFTHTRAH